MAVRSSRSFQHDRNHHQHHRRAQHRQVPRHRHRRDHHGRERLQGPVREHHRHRRRALGHLREGAAQGPRDRDRGDDAGSGGHGRERGHRLRHRLRGHRRRRQQHADGVDLGHGGNGPIGPALAPQGPGRYRIPTLQGGIAQLVEHLYGIQEASGSNPLTSTRFRVPIV